MNTCIVDRLHSVSNDLPIMMEFANEILRLYSFRTSEFLKSLLYTLSTSQIKGTCKKWWGCMQFADWFLISGKCVWFLCLSTSRKFFIKQWSGGSTDMFCRGCSSECNVKDVLMNQIWIDFGPKLLRNFSGIYFKFLRETVLVSRCSALNVDNLRATDRCQVTTNLYGTFLKSLLYTLSTSQIKGTCKKCTSILLQPRY